MVEGPVSTTPKGYQNEGESFWAPMTYEEAPQLAWPLNIAVYDKMRRTDPQVMSVLRALTLPIRRTGWRIDPNGARDEVVQFVADDLGLPIQGDEGRAVLRTRDRFDFGAYLRLSLLKLVFGHSFFEQVYTIDAAANRAHLGALMWLPPRTISAIDVSATGGLRSITQQAMVSSTTSGDPEIPVTQLVAHVNDREGGNWLGQSILRPAYKFWILKDQGIRKQAQVVDRNGMGVPVYTGPDMTTVEVDKREASEKNDLSRGAALAAGFRSGVNSGAAIPYGATLELKGVTGDLPDSDKPLRWYDEQIARAALANFLNLGGDNSTGSYALGSTFVDVFTESLEGSAGEFQDITNGHVIEDLVDINFGTSEPAPRLVHDEIGSRSPVTAEGIRALIECGALTADDKTESFLRTTFGMPQADPTTRREFKPAATTPPTTNPAPAPAADPTEE